MDITDFLPHGFALRSGPGGGDPKNGLCYLETVALIAGEQITDKPKCACPVLTAYGIGLNDTLDGATRQRLLPLAWATAGTRSHEHERQRLEILGRAAIECATLVLPIYESQFPNDARAREAIEAAAAYWDHPTREVAAAWAARAAEAAWAARAADPSLVNKIKDIAINALREAIEAGPNGGLPDKIVIERINAVRDMLPVRSAA